MKRRDFLKKLGVVCAAPVALAITTQTSPAKTIVGTASAESAIKIKPGDIEVIKGLGKAADKAAKATRDFSEGFLVEKCLVFSVWYLVLSGSMSTVLYQIPNN